MSDSKAVEDREALHRLAQPMHYPGSDYPVTAVAMSDLLAWFAARQAGRVLCTVTDPDHLHRAIHMDAPPSAERTAAPLFRGTP